MRASPPSASSALALTSPLAQHLIHQRQLFAVQPGQLAHAALAWLPARASAANWPINSMARPRWLTSSELGSAGMIKLSTSPGSGIGQIRVFRLRARAQGNHRQRKRFHAQPPAFGPATLMPMLGARPTGRARASRGLRAGIRPSCAGRPSRRHSRHRAKTKRRVFHHPVARLQLGVAGGIDHTG